MTLDELTKDEALKLAEIAEWKKDTKMPDYTRGFRGSVDDLRLTISRTGLWEGDRKAYYDFQVRHKNELILFHEYGRSAWQIYSIAEKYLTRQSYQVKHVKIVRDFLKTVNENRDRGKQKATE